MADLDLKLSERTDSSPTCVLCRAPLGDTPVCCTGCGVGLHAACRDDLSRCPTLGCGQTWERRAGAMTAPLPTFTPLLRSDRGDGRDDTQVGLTVLSLLLALLLVMFLWTVVRSPLDHAAEARALVSTPSTPDWRWEVLRPTAEAIAATPLRIDENERAVWSIGKLDMLGSYASSRTPEFELFHELSVGDGDRSLSLSFEDARRLFASVRLRALADPADGSNPWSSQNEGAAARVRITFARVQGSSEKGVLEATIRRLPWRAPFDTFDLRVTVKNGARELSWTETWPRALDPELRAAGPSSDAHLLSFTSDGDGRPVPVRAEIERQVAPYLIFRVTLERLDWRPGP